MPILRSREIIPKTPLKKTLETPLDPSTPSKTDALPPPLSSSTPSPSSTLESGFLSSGAATPPRRRSLRLASISTTTPAAAIPTEEKSSRRKRKARVSGYPEEGEIRALEESGSMNLRSGTRIARRRLGDEERDRSEEREKGKLGFRGDCFEVTGDPMSLEIGGRKIGGSEEKLDFETIVVEEAEEHSQIADGLMKDRRTRRKKGGNKFQREEKRSEVLELEPKVAAFKPDENDVKGKSKFVDKENWLSIDGVAEKMDFEATVEEEVEEKPQIEDGLMKRRRTWRAKEECRIEVIELVPEVASFKSEEKDGEEEEIMGLFSNMGERDGEGNGELEASLSKMADSSREDGMMRGIEVSSVSSDLAGKDGDQKVFSEERLKLILDIDCIEKISDKIVIDMGRGSMKDGGVEIGKTEICTDRRICSKEEKGKGKLVVEEDHMLIDKDEVKLEAGPIAVQEVGECTRNGEVSVKHRKGRKAKRSTKSRKEAERIRAIDLAPKFAFFKAEQEGSEEEEPEDFAANADQEWPGPFSTAMKIIEEREQKLRARELNSSSKKDEDTENRIQWVPSNDRKFKPFGKSAPTLNDLCMKVLCKNAEEIESLDGVPDVLKHRLISLLSRSRKMSLRILGLLVSGSPTEIHLSDCSWATEGQFGGVLDGCNVDNLKVVQLDFCGRCMPDYVLQATLARSPNCLPSLTTISLKGDYRLSDDGLNAIAASAPFLGSINLSQCSLLTSTGIIALADKLQSVLRELYIDDCQNVDAMLILPALKKLKYLEALSIAGIETVCDKFVKKLIFDCGANLRELVIAGCRKLTAASIQTIGESCSQLRSLDLRNLNRLNDSAIGHLANGCRSIQKLKLRCNAFSDEAIAAFVEASGGSLTELSLNNVEKVAKHTAVAISRRCSSTLRSLDLSFCRKMTDEALGLIVDSCSNLRILKLFGCTQVTDVFLEGHSNSLVKIVGLKGPIFEQIEMPDFL